MKLYHSHLYVEKSSKIVEIGLKLNALPYHSRLSFTLSEWHRYHTALQVLDHCVKLPLHIYIIFFIFWRTWQVILVEILVEILTVFLSPEYLSISEREVSFIKGLCCGIVLPSNVSEAASVSSFRNSFLNFNWFCFSTGFLVFYFIFACTLLYWCNYLVVG